MFLSKRQISVAEGVGGSQACASRETPRHQETDNHQGAKELEVVGRARPIKIALIKTQRVTGKLESQTKGDLRFDNFYNTTSVLRTIEHILGLPPLTHFDGTVPLILAPFQALPDLASYTAASARAPLDERNPAGNPTAARSQKLDLKRTGSGGRRRAERHSLARRSGGAASAANRRCFGHVVPVP